MKGKESKFKKYQMKERAQNEAAKDESIYAERTDDQLETCKLGNSSPAALAIGENEVDELLVFFSCPWPFLQSNFVTAWLPPHLNLIN